MIATAIAAVEVTVDGAPADAELSSRVLSVRVARRLGDPAQCELAFATGAGVLAEPGRIPLGAEILVRITGDVETLFDGEVTCTTLTHGPDGAAVLRVRGYDLLHRLRKRQRPRVFTDITVAELAERLAADDGLTVRARERGPTHQRIVQHGQTDYSLLREVAGAAGLYPVVEGDELRLVTLEGEGRPHELALGSNLIEARFEANLDRACGEITALGWDNRTAAPFEERAASPRLGRKVGIEPELADLGLDGEFVLVDQQGAGAPEVAARAQAELDLRAGGTVTLHGVATGSAELRAGSTIEVGGVAEPFAGTYVVTEAIHTLDATGYLTTLSTEPPRRDATAAAVAITLGTVSDVDDPEQLGRVRVALPSYGDADAGWLGVLIPGAGERRGLVALPDTGDTVLVALPHGPGSGIVLGSLYGAVKPPDPGVQGGRVRRWSLRTADGQSVVVDDAKHSVTVANRAGSLLRLAPGKVTLHSAADLDVTAPGRTITISANAVDFVHAPGRGGADGGA